jgi:ankyrin repeat protein
MILSVRKENSGEQEELPSIISYAYSGNVEGVALLLAKGVDVNTVDPGDNLSVLHIACLQGDTALARLILDHDQAHGDVDFTIRSRFRPRLAWQFAMNANFVELAELVDNAGVEKACALRESSDPSPQP